MLSKYQILLTILILADLSFAGTARLKDLVNVKGNRENPLMGLGLVVGLSATGDTSASLATNKATARLISKLGIDIKSSEVLNGAIAAVVVTGSLPAFSKNGDKIDVKVSVLGDAASLAGGQLLMTPLKAGDGRVYVIAEGPVIVGGATGVGASTLTSAVVSDGGTVEREFIPKIVQNGVISLNLKEPDFTTNARLTKEINRHFKGFFATSVDPTLLQVKVPSRFSEKIIQFLSEMENLRVERGTKSVVVLNERTGTVVMGNDVTIADLVIAHGDLSIRVSKEKDAVGESLVNIKGATVGELVEGLNALGVTPKELTSILQAINAAGALNGELKNL